jgi:hypothetical protein
MQGIFQVPPPAQNQKRSNITADSTFTAALPLLKHGVSNLTLANLPPALTAPIPC